MSQNYWCSLGKGGYTASEDHIAYFPLNWLKASTQGVIYCHGATKPVDQPRLTSEPFLRNCLEPIYTTGGLPLMSCSFGGDLWGNDTNITQIEAARTYFNTQYGVTTGTKVALIGGSMGGLAAMNYARANPTKVSCLVLMLPVSDVNDMVTNNRLGLAASINTAYSTYNDGTQGPTHSPVQYAAQLSGIPTQIWYATDDTVVIPSTVQTVIAAHGSVDVHTITGSHTDAAFGNITTQTVIDFLKAHPGS